MTADREICIYVFKQDEKSRDKRSDERICRCAKLFLCREADKSGGSLPSLSVIRREGEKPRFLADIRLHFSVSHSGGFWVCAVSRQEVGIDLEKKKNDYNRGIAKRYFHASEHKYLEDNGFDNFFLIWTAKESYVKFIGCGIGGGFSDFSVVKDGCIDCRVNGAELRFLPFDPQYSLCVCAKSLGEVFVIRKD